MDQEKIGKFIKDIRLKNKMTQQQFAEKYCVSFQAVSKWERGLNLPDITILKQICADNNISISEILEDKKTNKRKKIIIISFILVILTSIIATIVLVKRNDYFEFKKISTTCEDFNLYGSIAYSNNKTSIYISNITYCGKEDDKFYQNIKASLYEQDGSSKTIINSYEDKNISLEEFLKKVNFNVDHYTDKCQMYKENGLIVEIEATIKNKETVLYKIPLILEDNC